MKTKYAIEVNNISKSFKVFLDKGHTFKEVTLFKQRRRYEERKVLQNISFKVVQGEALGLIGENGCGKSTTLKLLTRIMYPDEGTITMRGRVSSLIELGAGFHPDMSGRENIYTNASIFGLTKKEIDARVDSIIEFSELGEYIDNPVRTYSSGMYMRLAFSVAINVDADILLVDEILAVGDTNFQTKCFNHLRELKAKGITIVIVTHDTGTVSRFCDKAIWINKGKIAAQGNSQVTVDRYLEYMAQKRIETALGKDLIHEDSPKSEAENKAAVVQINSDETIKTQEDEAVSEVINNSAAAEPVIQEEETDTQEVEAHEAEVQEVPAVIAGDENQDNSEKRPAEAEAEENNAEELEYTSTHFGLKYVEITQAYFLDQKGNKTTILQSGKNYILKIHYKVNKKLDQYVFGFGFFTMDGMCIMGNNTQLDGLRVQHKTDEGVVQCRFPNFSLLSGTYILNIAIVDENGTPMDYYRDFCHIEVISMKRSVGVAELEHYWVV